MTTMRGDVLVIGAGGQLGRALLHVARADGRLATGLTRACLDLGDVDAVEAALAAYSPGCVINAAAYTNVDQAEDEPEAAYAANAHGPANLARVCARHGVALVHVSTDYVFDGRGDRPWRPNDPTGPIGVYGASKLAGETEIRASGCRAAIVRTGWLFAPWGHNFVRTMLRLAGERPRLTVVDDQWGGPTSALDLARALLTVAADVRPGVYHYGGQPGATWCDFARAVVAGAASIPGSRRPEVIGISTSEYPTRARRPAYSVLDSTGFTHIYGVPAPDWRAGLEETMALLGAHADKEFAT